jgi:hypothetical protein
MCGSMGIASTLSEIALPAQWGEAVVNLLTDIVPAPLHIATTSLPVVVDNVAALPGVTNHSKMPPGVADVAV